jgi:D-amino-acid oxidase
LYTPYMLVKQGVPGNHITIVAQHHHGDQSINYTSPNAGGNFSTIWPDDTDTFMFDGYTYEHLDQVRQDLGPNCGLEKIPILESYDYMPPQQKLVIMKQYAEDFELYPKKNSKTTRLSWLLSIRLGISIARCF